MIHTKCPECGEALSFADDTAGATLPCRHCRLPLKVPPCSDSGPAPKREAPFSTPEEDRPLSPAWYVAIAAAVSLGLIGLSYQFAGNFVLFLIAGLGLLFSGAILFFGFWAVVKAGFSSNNLDWRRILVVCGVALYVGATCGACMLMHALFAVADVHIDNATPRPVQLVLDGKEWMTVPARGQATATLRIGTYRLEVLPADGGAALDTMSISLNEGKPHVLNVMGAQVYSRGSVDYGGFGFGAGPSEQRITDKWFKADVDYLFQTPPEKITVTTKQGQPAMATRSYLRRGKPKRARE